MINQRSRSCSPNLNSQQDNRHNSSYAVHTANHIQLKKDGRNKSDYQIIINDVRAQHPAQAEIFTINQASTSAIDMHRGRQSNPAPPPPENVEQYYKGRSPTTNIDFLPDLSALSLLDEEGRYRDFTPQAYHQGHPMMYHPASHGDMHNSPPHDPLLQYHNENYAYYQQQMMYADNSAPLSTPNIAHASPLSRSPSYREYLAIEDMMRQSELQPQPTHPDQAYNSRRTSAQHKPRSYSINHSSAYDKKSLHLSPLSDSEFVGEKSASPKIRSRRRAAKEKMATCSVLSSVNVYIKQLPEEIVNEAKLLELCSPYGSLVSIRLFVHPQIASRGYAFALYENPADAAVAVDALCKLGHPASFAKESFSEQLQRLQNFGDTNIYISNLPLMFTEERFRFLLEPFCNAISLRLLPCHEGDLHRVGFARMRTHTEGLYLIAILNGSIPPGFNEAIQIRFADNEAQKELKRKQMRKHERRSNTSEISA